MTLREQVTLRRIEEQVALLVPPVALLPTKFSKCQETLMRLKVPEDDIVRRFRTRVSSPLTQRVGVYVCVRANRREIRAQL